MTRDITPAGPAVAPGSAKPGVAQVRLIGPPQVIDAALALLAGVLGEAWQPSTRKPGRHAGGDHLQYGTLIVPVPARCAMKRRVLLVRDQDGSQMTIGPVGTDQSVDQLCREVTARGWAVLAVVPHYSRADFTGANGRGMGPAEGAA